MAWTDKQEKAISARHKSLLVSAAAGSGKTAVLVERVIRLIRDEDVSLENMLIVTFTNAAAAEMKLPKQVLIVDDSPVNRKVLAAFLKQAGISVIHHAGDGKEALAEIDAAMRAGQPYDFIFSDLWMPNMNGFEFIEQLRADSRFRDLPVLALTADTEFRRDKRAELFTGILLKPLTYDKLVKFLAAHS